MIMSSSVKLNYGGTDYKVHCSNVIIGWKNNNLSKPNANGTTVAQSQTQSFDNPIYTLQGVYLIEGTGNLTYSSLLTMAKNRYDGTNPITFTFDYGIDTSTILPDSSGATSGIKVVINSFNFPISINEYGTSSKRHLLNGTIILQETA